MIKYRFRHVDEFGNAWISEPFEAKDTNQIKQAVHAGWTPKAYYQAETLDTESRIYGIDQRGKILLCQT